MTGGPWQGGIAVRRMDRGQVAVADFLCTACWLHRRVTGRALVTDFLASQPIEAHRTVCTTPTTAPAGANPAGHHPRSST